MDGEKLLLALGRKLRPKGKRPLNRNQLARVLGVTGAALWKWQKQKAGVTPAQVANLVAKARVNARSSAQQDAIRPIIEFFRFDPADSKQGKQRELFPAAQLKKRQYLRGLAAALRNANGVYLLYDSRGRALYAGKAVTQSLWSEIKSALNRKRDLQKVKRVKHPADGYRFLTSDEKQRQISSRRVPLSDLARYVSAYSVPQGFINTVEAMLIRAFANDLLNARMEKFARPGKGAASRKRRHRRA